MKLTFLTASVSRNAGGLFQSVRRLAQSVLCGGSQVSVLGVEDEHTAGDIGNWHPLQVQTYPVIGPDRFHFAPKLVSALTADAPDVLSSHGLWNYTSIASARWHSRTGKPYIVHPHGMLDSWAVRNAQWKKFFSELLYEKRNLRGATCIRALCASEANSIRAYGLTNPICVIPNGIDLPQVDHTLVEHGPLPVVKRAGYNILLSLGRLHPKKGLANLLRAWRAAMDAQPHENPWVLAIAGWEEKSHETELKRLASEIEISWADAPSGEDGEGWFSERPSVIFLGPQFGRAKTAAYHNCDAFILPSFSEGLPMAVLEAWSHAKPALITPGCNLPEGFDAGAALRIEPGAESIRAGLEQLFEMSERERQTIGALGRQMVTERFSWPRIAREMQATAEWLLGGGLPPECIRKGETL